MLFQIFFLVEGGGRDIIPTLESGDITGCMDGLFWVSQPIKTQIHTPNKHIVSFVDVLVIQRRTFGIRHWDVQ